MSEGIGAIGIALCLLSFAAEAKTVRYELTIAREKVNLSGKQDVDFSLNVNGGVPAPVLEFTEGDDAEIVVKNRVPSQETSIHWHGLLLPPEMDGVPYVNSPPIQPGGEYVFKFKIRQHGTYWYHSHTMTQEQEGVYGAFVIHPKKESIHYGRDLVVVLSDWSDESGQTILDHLRKDGDYYLYKKGTMRSWLGAIQARRLGNYLGNEWSRMGGMDLSDVGYDAFLINGKRDLHLASAKAGEVIRLRVINAAASSYFYVALGQKPMKVVSADGVDIEPVFANELLMGMAETYDVLFTVPENKSYELRATAQDGTGFASGWIGDGERVEAPARPLPDQYASMDHTARGDGAHGTHSEHGENTEQEPHGGHAQHEHDDHKGLENNAEINPAVETLTVDELRAQRHTALPESTKIYELKLTLGGDMSRYIWHINNKAIHEDRNVVVNEGDVVRITFENQTMMHHPMHLHGHFFRVLNNGGVRSPLKHTVDVPPHKKRVIEFLANEPGEWMLHCHNLFHMNTGMARVMKYISFTPTPEITHLQHKDHHLHDPWYFYGNLEAATHHGQAQFRLSQTWNDFVLRAEIRKIGGTFSYADPWEWEGDFFYRRWLNQYLHLMAGAIAFDQRFAGAIGFGYLFPMLIESHILIDYTASIRVNLEKRFQWAKHFYTDVDFSWRPGQGRQIGNDIEYEVTLMFAPNWTWAMGLMLTDRNVGLGVSAKF